MSDSLLYRRSSVGSSMPSSGWCLARMPIEPTVVRVETISTSSLKTDPSGVRTSAVNFSLATSGPPRGVRSWTVGCRRRLARTQDRRRGSPRRVSEEAADRLRDRHVRARRSRELLGDVERLRQEALDAPRAADRQAVLVGELVDAEDRDD